MLSVSTRRALRLQQAAASLSRVPSQMPPAASFSTSQPDLSRGYGFRYSERTAQIYEAIRKRLYPLLTLNSQRPGILEPLSERSRRRSTGRNDYASLQRRFEKATDEELIEALLSSHDPGSTFLATQLFLECDCRDILKGLTEKELHLAVKSAFPSSSIWRKSTTLSPTAAQRYGETALDCLHALISLIEARSIGSITLAHTDVQIALEHIAEIGHSQSWQQAWSLVQSTGVLKSSKSNNRWSYQIQLKAMMRQSECLLSHASTTNTERHRDNRRRQLQSLIKPATELLLHAQREDCLSPFAFSMALRVVKNAGDYQALCDLLQRFTGLNLEAPEPQSCSGPAFAALFNPHCFNTILMALGEAGEISKMVAFFQTISCDPSCTMTNSQQSRIVTSKTYETLIKGCSGRPLLLQHFFDLARSAMEEYFTRLEDDLKHASQSGSLLSQQHLLPRVTMTEDILTAFMASSRSRTAPLQRSADSIRACVDRIVQHQYRMLALITQYTQALPADALKDRKTPANLKAYLIQTEHLYAAAQHAFDVQTACLKASRVGKVRRAMLADIKALLDLSEEQEKRVNATLARMTGKQLQHLRATAKPQLASKAISPKSTAEKLLATEEFRQSSTSPKSPLFIYKQNSGDHSESINEGLAAADEPRWRPT